MRYGLTFYPVAVAVLYGKLHQMEDSSGRFWYAARNLGKIESFTLWEKLSFFQADFFISCFAVPVLLVLVLRLSTSRWRAIWAGGFSLLLFLLFYVQLKAFNTVGTFLSSTLLMSAVEFAIQHPDSAPFLSWSGLIKPGAVATAVLVITIWAARRDRHCSTNNVAHRTSYRLLGTSIGCLLLGLIACSLSRLPRTRYHESLLVRALSSYWDRGGDRREEFRHRTVSELVSTYRQLVGASESQPDPREWGRASDYDVIFFVLETVPARCLDLRGDLQDYSNLRLLRDHALIGERHYSTYPYTSFALFSLLSSWYPPSSGRSFVRQFPGAPIPGLVAALRSRGYQAGVFSAWRSTWEPDSQMFAMLGFNLQAYPDERATRARGPKRLDEVTLELLRRQLLGWWAQDQRYVAVFLPQITHGPWQDPDSLAAPTTDLLTRCRRLVGIQDRWLGELLDELRIHGRLGRTIIVISADHGVRDRIDDPTFVAGMVDEYSFRVPLLVYVPGVIDHTYRIRYVTSHIDVVPTVLDLMGVQRSRELEQGMPIWDGRLEDRTTFFFAGGYLGADGYHAKGQFYGRNEVADLVYAQAPQLHFGPENMAPDNSPHHREVTELIGRMSSLQREWALRILGSGESPQRPRRPGSVTPSRGAVRRDVEQASPSTPQSTPAIGSTEPQGPR